MFALINKINLFGLMATLFIGQNKVFLPETDSTNSYAINLLKNVKCFEGTVVYTNHQTDGKGQRGNTWHSEPSMNCIISIILKPHFLSAKNSFYLSKITALAVHDVLAELLADGQYDIKIKWPNDILVNHKKIAGILIENQFQDDNLKWSVIGIGLNINQINFNNLIATSVKLLNGKTHIIESVNEKIFEHLEKWYLALKQNQLSHIDQFYHQHLFGFENVLNFEINGHRFSAKIVSVTESGLLKLDMLNGTISEFELKQISFIY